MKNLLTLFIIINTPSFGQSSLDNYLKEAVENNPGLKAVYANFEASLAVISQAKSLPDPTFSFGYFISPVETRVGAQKVKFSLSQMFPWFGTLPAKEEEAALIAESKYQEFLESKNGLDLKVKIAFYEIYEIEQKLYWTKENLKILDTHKSLAINEISNNKGTLSKALRIDILLENKRTNILVLGKKLQTSRTNFNYLLNRNLASVIEIELPDLIDIPVGYRKDSLEHENPQLALINKQLQASVARETIAENNARPSFGVGLDYAIVEKRTDFDVQDNGKDIFMPMVSVSLPLFKKKNQSAVKEAQLQRNSLQWSKKDLENKLLSSYEQAWFELDKSRKLIQLYKIQISSTERVINLLQSSFSNSESSLTELLNTQQELISYKMANVTAMKNLHIALAKLDYITSK